MDIKTLYDTDSTMYVLGALLRQPSLVHENKYVLTTNDFDGVRKIIFGAIYNLSAEGVVNMTPQDIDLYLKQSSPKQYKEYREKMGYEYLLELENRSTVVDINQFDYYYERVKKFTILRDLAANGFDTTPFYNPNVDFTEIDKEHLKFNNLEISEIFNRLRERIATIEDSHVSKNNLKAKEAGEGIFELLEELSISPEVGFQLDGDILNYASRGARLGKFYLYSAPTGHGKTRFFVGQACALSMPYIKNGKIVQKDHLSPVLFIATEMEPDEIQTLILAYVSGVDEDKILKATMNEEEKKLVYTAAQLIKENSKNFIIEKISDPSIASVRSKIVKYIVNNNINHVFYDYIFTSPSLNMEFARTGLREDVTLMMMANTLKEIAADFNVFIYSGTQVNRDWEKRTFRNENSLAGSKAIADKADFAAIAVKLYKEEYQHIEDLVREGNFKEPNMVMDIYKNRRGRITNAKLFRFFDHATCRSEDIFITDTSYKILPDVGRIVYTYQLRDLLEVAVDNKNVNGN